MIYVSVGNHFMGFERLLRMADEAARKTTEDWFAQIGCSSYVPQAMKFERFISYARSYEYIRNAACVISHAGIGTIINAERCGTPVIIVPRRKTFGEHTNDHQMEIVSALKAQPRPNVIAVEEISDLETILAQVLEKRAEKRRPYHADRKKIATMISDFLKSA